jgi:hypothetical protein
LSPRRRQKATADADFLGEPRRPLAECARGQAVNFYYCFEETGERVEAVVADVGNIPWGESHPYVLRRGAREGTVLSDEIDKTLHVSPLIGMEQTYAYCAGDPGAPYFPHPEGSRPKGFLSP